MDNKWLTFETKDSEVILKKCEKDAEGVRASGPFDRLTSTRLSTSRDRGIRGGEERGKNG